MEYVIVCTVILYVITYYAVLFLFQQIQSKHPIVQLLFNL